MPARRPSICLNMIVKDEEAVIERCLRNVRPLIDSWVIVDTGSTDATMEIVRDVLSDLPGALHERPWKNFGHNRSEAIRLADGMADYILTIDADETIERAKGFAWGDLDADCYMIEKRRQGRVYRVMNLVRDGLDWRWEGVVHEYLDSPRAGRPERLDGLCIRSPREGARARDANTFRRDALLLEQAVLEGVATPRDIFYLAQSYRDAEDYDLAIRNYHRRVELGGWEEEVFVSLLNISRMKRWRGESQAEVLVAALAAHSRLPDRIEPLYDIGMDFAAREDWANAWLFLERAARFELNPDYILFLEAELYEWRAKLEAAVAAYWVGEHDAALALNERLLSEGYLPQRLRARVEENMRLSREAMRAVA